MTQILLSKPRHKWPKDGEPGFTHVLRDPKGRERFERVCKVCGITRITLLPPWPDHAWHEWKLGNRPAFQMESTPPCSGTPAETLREFTEVQAI